MTKTQHQIAIELRKKIGAHFELMGLGVDAETYQRKRSESDLATQMARYLGQHMVGIDRKSWGAACGVRMN